MRTSPRDDSPVCYFDITDIVSYAMQNTRVSGIQRVQLNLLAHMVQRHGGRAVRCTFEHPRDRAMVEIDPTALLQNNEFDSDLILRQLDLGGQSRIFPSKVRMRRYLSRYRGHNLRRALAKAGIYLTALLFPGRLARMGLHRPTAAELAVVPVAQARVDRLPVNSAFICLGATWSLPRILAFGRAHAERGGAVVQLIYDLIPQVHPEYFARDLADDFKRWLTEIVQHTNLFICISRWTAADLQRFVGARNDIQIRAVAMAHEFARFERFAPVVPNGGDALEAASVPFVLCVGTLEVRKNGAALLQAWRLLGKRLGVRLPRLVFAGKQGWLIQEFRATLANDPELAQRVHIVESPSDQDLAFLYQRCLFTAYPSRYEGWGLPVGEAAWFGKYVISSNATSLPEVCGDLIDYFDPADLDALCGLLERAITEPAYVRAKEEAIARSPMRLWSDVADDIHRLIVMRDDVARPVAAAHHHVADNHDS
jgi:glycosyltransferase involved in cell wall biosynthesis